VNVIACVPLVLVEEPWPVPHLFVPRESTVEIHCMAGESQRGYSSFWLLDLANDGKSSLLLFNPNHQEELLNAHSVYQLPRIETPEMPPGPTVRLLINDTTRNNQTEMQCDRSTTSGSTTTLFVLGKALSLSISDLSISLTSLFKLNCRSCNFTYWGHCGHGYQP
jgi:hypothetical protein